MEFFHTVVRGAHVAFSALSHLVHDIRFGTEHIDVISVIGFFFG